MSEPAPATADAKPRGGFFREWVLPIAIGLALGVGIVMLWKRNQSSISAMFRSDAAAIVDRWEYGALDENDKLAEELKALGKEARADLLAAFRGIDVPPNPFGEDEWKVWTGQALAGEPFFDSRSLLELARDPAAPEWDRRAAAAALVATLAKDVDPTAVTEPLLAWIEDLSVLDHGLALNAVRQMRTDQVFPPDQDERLRKALVRLADRDRPVPAGGDETDAIRVTSDRDRALRALATWLSHDDVKKAVWKAALDESDDTHVRAAAVQILAGNGQFDDPEAWKRLAASTNEIVRQTVAENLMRADLPALDEVLVKLHRDPAPLVRKGSVEAQVRRKRPTMLAMIDELVEDHDPWVRREALIASGAFRDFTEGLPARYGMALRLLESSDAPEDVEGAVLSLYLATGQSFGFAPADVDVGNSYVRDTAIDAFIADVEGRKATVAKWREHLGGTAVWTDADRKATLTKLLQHADPANVERAKAELAKLGG